MTESSATRATSKARRGARRPPTGLGECHGGAELGERLVRIAAAVKEDEQVLRHAPRWRDQLEVSASARQAVQVEATGTSSARARRVCGG
jgi:hypothetical protein